MKKIISGALLGLFVCGAALPAWALRIATVDVAEVIDQSDQAKNAKDELKKEAAAKRGDLEKEQSKLGKEVEDLQAKKSVLSSDKFEAAQNKLRAKAQALQAKVQEMQDELAGEEKKKTQAIVDLVRGLASDVAKEEKYDFVMEKNTLLYGGDDITYKVIQKMNKD